MCSTADLEMRDRGTRLVDVSEGVAGVVREWLRVSIWGRFGYRVGAIAKDHVEDQVWKQVGGRVRTMAYDLISRRV